MAHNHANNPTDPGLWSRIEWTNFGSQLMYYCLVLGDAAAEADALAAGPADPTDEWGGCNAAAWEYLDPSTTAFAASGVYLDENGTDVQITSSDWIETSSAGVSAYAMRIYGITQPYAVMQNDPANASYPSLYSRFDITWSGGDLWVCHTVQDGATQAVSELATEADPASPSASGCAGGPWRNLTP